MSSDPEYSIKKHYEKILKLSFVAAFCISALFVAINEVSADQIVYEVEVAAVNDGAHRPDMVCPTCCRKGYIVAADVNGQEGWYCRLICGYCWNPDLMK